MKANKVFANETIYLSNCKGFTKVSNHITHNNKLSITEVGLIAKLLSNDPGYVINKETEQLKSGLGVKAFRKSWAILEQEGYIVSKKTRSGRGYRYEYIISNLPIAGDNQEALSNHYLTTDTEQAVQKCRLQRTASKGVLNTDIKNTELRKKELSNIEKTKLEITNTGKLAEAVEGISGFSEGDEVFIHSTTSSTGSEGNIDNTIHVISSAVSEGSIDNTLHIRSSTGFEENIDDTLHIISSTGSEGSIDNTLHIRSSTGFEENTDSYSSNHVGISNVHPTVIEPATELVQPEKKPIVFSSIQEEVKHRIRVYVIQNKILPTVIKEELELIYSWDTFSGNTQNLDAEGLFQYAVRCSGINNYIGTASPNSIQNKILRMADEYIKHNNIDPTDAKQRIDTYLSDSYNAEKFYQIDQHANPEQRFEYFLGYTKLRTAKRLPDTRNKIIAY